nr:MAG TPA: hypothetical protein [Caudoviricetes sp.]
MILRDLDWEVGIPLMCVGKNFVVEICEHVCMWDLCFQGDP